MASFFDILKAGYSKDKKKKVKNLKMKDTLLITN